MIPSQVVQFPFLSGIDEGIDPKTVKPGVLKTLKNYAWTKDGQLEKRNGTLAISTDILGGGTISQARRLAVHNDQLVLINDTGFYTYSSRSLSWALAGSLPRTGLTWSNVTATHGEGIQAADIGITSSGLKVIAYVKGDPTAADATTSGFGDLLVQLIEPEGRIRTMGPFGLNGANFCRVLINGNDWAVVFNDPTGPLNLVTSAGALVGLAADGKFATYGYVPFDACMTEDISGDFLLVYEEIAGDSLIIDRFTFAGVLSDTDVVEAAPRNRSAVGITSTPEGDVYVTWGYAANADYAVHDEATLTQTLAPTNYYTDVNLVVSHVAACRADPSSAMLVMSGRVTSGSSLTQGITHIGQWDNVGANILIWETKFTRSISRPFTLGGEFYIFLADFAQSGELSDGGGQENLFPGNNTYLATFSNDGTSRLNYSGLIDITVGGIYTQGSLPSVANVSSTEKNAVLPYLFQGAKINLIWAQGLRLGHLTVGDSVPEDIRKGVQLGPETYYSGSYFSAFDGRLPFDFGFPRTTPLGTTTTALGAGGAMVAGDYRFQLVPVFPSAAGIKHRGPASPVFKLTIVANGRASLFWLDMALAWKQSVNDDFKPYAEIYRTEVNLGQMHKRTIEPSFGFTTGSTFIDGSADSNVGGAVSIRLGNRPGIYTDAEYDDFAPPASTTVHVHKDRLWVISGDQRTLWYSKNFNEDQTVAPAFNPSAILNFEEELVALGSADEKLIVFSGKSIWYVLGNGPTVNGDNSDYAPIQLQTDVGCISPRSVVETPDGVMFQSQRGLYLLTRGLELQWIGKPVRDTLAAFPVVTSARLIPDLNQVRFTCNNTAGTNGRVLVFDHVRKQWSVFEYTAGVTVGTPIADAVVLNGVYTFVTPAGQVYQEDPTTSIDTSVWVYGEIETAEIFGDGPLSYHRVRRAYFLGDRVSDCDASIQIAVAGAASYAENSSWTNTELSSIGSGNIGKHIRNQKAQSIRVRWTDAPPTGAAIGTGRGLKFSALGFEIAPKRGLDKRAAEQRK